MADKLAPEGRQSNGEWLVKTLKPLGCVIVLVIMVLMIIMCVTSGRDPIKGFSPEHDTAYYSLHTDELLDELNAEVFPHLDGIASASESGGRVRIEIDYDSFVVSRAALLRYYDESLFELVQLEK